MKRVKKLLVLALAALMCLSAVACGADMGERITKLVKGNLDEIYLGEFSDEYIKLVNSTKEDCQEVYEAGLRTEAEYFCSYFSVEYPDEELMDEIVEMYKAIYAHSNYEVNNASKLDDRTYAVKVQIRPIDIIETVYDNFDEYMDDFYSRYQDVDFDAMTDEEYMAFDRDWAESIIAVIYDLIPQMGFKDEQSIAVQVVKGDDDMWAISDSDMSSIDSYIIYYP